MQSIFTLQPFGQVFFLKKPNTLPPQHRTEQRCESPNPSHKITHFSLLMLIVSQFGRRKRTQTNLIFTTKHALAHFSSQMENGEKESWRHPPIKSWVLKDAWNKSKCRVISEDHVMLRNAVMMLKIHRNKLLKHIFTQKTADLNTNNISLFLQYF